ncbi:MAG: UBP-type zinc finger domain-containing protein [Anaerolineae bacterium]|nr:UBP-type zinc finger domain-containing protein [Anaerolineae bacterium]
MNVADCTHLNQIEIQDATRKPGAVCEDCVKTGDRWVHLRICLTCGHVGCCDSSKNKHASQHARESGHSIVQSYEPGESWRWCYIDRHFV